VSRRYFPLPEDVSSRGIGQPVITLDRIHIPIRVPPAPDGEATKLLPLDMALDSNLLFPNDYSPEIG